MHLVRRGRLARRRRASRSRRRARPRPCSVFGSAVRKRSRRVARPDADEQHAGRVGIERAGVADPPLAEHRRRVATTSCVVQPAGLSTTREAVRHRRRRLVRSSSGSSATRRSARGGSRRCARPCARRCRARTSSIGVRLQACLPADRGLQRDAVLAERLEHLGVASPPRGGVEADDGAAEVGVDVDRGDRHELEPLVVDALELLGHDLAQQLVQPRRAGILARRLRDAVASASSLQPPPLGRQHLDLGMRPDEALHLVDDVASRGAGCRRRPRSRAPARCHWSWWSTSAAGHAEPAACTLDDRLHHAALHPSAIAPRGRCRSTARVEHVHGSAPVAQLRAISRSSNVSMMSPGLRSWKSDEADAALEALAHLADVVLEALAAT